MISVDEALDRLLSLVEPLESEEVPLSEAHGRALAEPVAARRDQPPFRSSAMDGYALSDAAPGRSYRVIGVSAAGRGWNGRLGTGEAVRIFTGAPVPEGADRVVIQEEAVRDGDRVTLAERLDPSGYIREAGGDFHAGDIVSPRRLRAVDLLLLAAMNIARVPVTRRPIVALIATGDELVMPGESPRDDQIVASNAFGLAATVRDAGGEARMLPIARDTPASLQMAFELAAGADLVVTIGGASVGDHDLVAEIAGERGLDAGFHKVAMRPGKPLLAGRIADQVLLGLPGNPVSSMVCAHVFMLPMLRAMLGLGRGPAPRREGVLAAALDRNGPREHYMRARVTPEGLVPADRQDSSLISIIANADALIVRPPHDSPRAAGARIEYLPLP